jgi:hypothetical protein
VFDSVPDPLVPGAYKDFLYVDRNGNGDLTEADERIEALVHEYEEFSRLGGVRPSKTRMLEFSVGALKDKKGNLYKDVKITVQWFMGSKRPCFVEMTSPGIGGQRAEIGLVFAERPEDAPVLHFGGPLTMRFALGSVHGLSLTEEFSLQAEVGTPGRGPNSFVSLSNASFPKDLHPKAVIEFPHRAAAQPPIRMEITLDHRC